MEHRLELATRLRTETEFKSLYPWSLQDFRADETPASRPLIPFHWGLYFRAKGVKRYHRIKQESYPETAISDADFISASLESVGGEFGRPVRFSMFGTNRAIEDITLEIHRMRKGIAREQCHVGATVEWELKDDFSSKTEMFPDCLYFHIDISPERYDRLIEALGDLEDVEIGLSVSGVPGLYSEWSPDIKTGAVKVLTPDQHKLELPEGCTIKPPTLDSVDRFDINLHRTLRAEPPPAAPDPDEDEHDYSYNDEPVTLKAAPRVGLTVKWAARVPTEGDLESEPGPPQRPGAAEQFGAAALAQLSQVKFALWGVAALLVVILLFKH